MIVRNGKNYKYSEYITVTDDEANTYKTYGDKNDIHAYIYPASGQVQSNQYGKDLGYILNLLTNENKLKEGDGLCVYSDEVDYEVISIKRYTGHFFCELKKI